jgi:DNA-binding NarL/FixJ family response regulator
LAAALKAASEGLIAIDERLGSAIVSSGGRQTQSHVEPLTRRELEILELVAAGMTNKAIASHVGISEHTVKFHVNALLGKLGAQSRTQAVTTATRMGLIRL